MTHSRSQEVTNDKRLNGPRKGAAPWRQTSRLSPSVTVKTDLERNKTVARKLSAGNGDQCSESWARPSNKNRSRKNSKWGMKLTAHTKTDQGEWIKHNKNQKIFSIKMNTICTTNEITALPPSFDWNKN
jgi:hypothetical protein